MYYDCKKPAVNDTICIAMDTTSGIANFCNCMLLRPHACLAIY